MSLAVRVAVESPLLQLDREFDFLVPEKLHERIKFGQRVAFRLGRSKALQTGFIIEVLESSAYATGHIDSIVSETPVLREEILDFARQVSARQCVALGEILQLAVPDHMARTKTSEVAMAISKPVRQVTREVVLTGPQVKVGHCLYPSWMELFLRKASSLSTDGYSSLVLVPEQSDVDSLVQLAEYLNVRVTVWETRQRSKRFQVFHAVLGATAIVIGTRSAIYAPVANLALIAVADDADDSYREVGSPHTHLRDLALIRAGDHSSIIFAAPYRSVELQRLVEIGYLKEFDAPFKPLRMAFSDPGIRIDDASLKLARESLRSGTLLVLVPRKGMSSALFCSTCGERMKCPCGGFVWEPRSDHYECRICSKPQIACAACRSTSLRRGRSGSTRTTAEIGKMFPGTAIFEASGERKPEIESKSNQVLVATAGSAPRLSDGYSGLLILDTDVWLSAQHLRAEQLAVRDWFEAIELLHPNARVVFAGLGAQLGKPLALGHLREMARTAYLESKQLGLPPAVRVAELSASKENLAKCLDALRKMGVETIRNDGVTALIRFDYAKGAAVTSEIRGFATAAKAIQRGVKNVRGFTVKMDSEVL